MYKITESLLSRTACYTTRHFLPHNWALLATLLGTSCHITKHFLPHYQALLATLLGTSCHAARHFLWIKRLLHAVQMYMSYNLHYMYILYIICNCTSMYHSLPNTCTMVRKVHTHVRVQCTCTLLNLHIHVGTV